MIIVSQDKKKITEKLNLYISKNLINNEYIFFDENDRNFGEYVTEDRAKEILQKLIQAYREYRTAECDGYTNVLEETAVFEMPED